MITPVGKFLVIGALSKTVTVGSVGAIIASVGKVCKAFVVSALENKGSCSYGPP